MRTQTGDIKKQFYKQLFSAVSGAIVVALFSFVDTIAVGQGVGPNGTAAIAVCVPIFNSVSFVGILCGIGGATLYGHAKGECNTKKANEYFTLATLAAVVVTIIIAFLLWVFRTDIYMMCGADEVILPYAAQYGNWCIIGFPFFVCAQYLPCFLRNDDRPALVLTATVTGAAINIFLDWFFVFPMNWGMSGAAYASVIGAIVQSLVLLTHFFSKCCTLRFVRLKFFLRRTTNIFSSGFGASFQYISVIITSIIMNNQIVKYVGNIALAIYGVIITVVALCQNIYSGIGQAAQPLISVNYGAKKMLRVKQSYRMMFIATMIFSLIFTVVAMAFPITIIKMFMDTTPAVLEMAPGIMRIYFISLAVSGFSITAIIYLQAIEKVFPATATALLRGLILNCVLVLILPLIMGAAGIWWAIVCAEVATFLGIVIYIVKLNKKLWGLSTSSKLQASPVAGDA